MERKSITQEELVNLWLVPAYGKRVEELYKEEAMDLFNRFPVSQQMCDEWEKNSEDHIMKKLKCSKRYMLRTKWEWYLNCAPKIV